MCENLYSLSLSLNTELEKFSILGEKNPCLLDVYCVVLSMCDRYVIFLCCSLLLLLSPD